MLKIFLYVILRKGERNVRNVLLPLPDTHQTSSFMNVMQSTISPLYLSALLLLLSAFLNGRLNFFSFPFFFFFFCSTLLQLPWARPQGQGLPLSENSLEGSKKEERRRERGEEDKEKERGRREEAGEGTSGALPLPWQFKPCSIWRAPLNYVSR